MTEIGYIYPVRRQVGIVISIIPFGLVLYCEPAIALRFGTHLAHVGVAWVLPLSRVTQSGVDYDPFSATVFPTSTVAVDDAIDEDVEALALVSGEKAAANSGIAKRRKPPVTGSAVARVRALPSIRVPQAVVLRLARSGVRPTGKPVVAVGGRPAGIQVFGVSALGIGVRDGDVLTHVSGVPVTQVGQVIAMVIAARGARKSTVMGQLWRGNSSYLIVFEQPYPRVIDTKTASQYASPDDELLSGRASLDGI